MHFFSPANIMRLVEIVRGRDTSPETLATLLALARKLGKVAVVVGNCHGFVGNRMLRQRNVAAERVLLEGALPQEIDAALVDFGFPMGPLAASDLAGLDIGWRMRKAAGFRAEIADALCERGRFGQKTGQGLLSLRSRARARRFPILRSKSSSSNRRAASASRAARSPPTRSSSGFSIR